MTPPDARVPLGALIARLREVVPDADEEFNAQCAVRDDAADRLAALEALLERATAVWIDDSWENGDKQCAVCLEDKPSHAPDCWLRDLLALAGSDAKISGASE